MLEGFGSWFSDEPIKYRRSFFVKEIIYFNKKEKFFETKNEILNIESFRDEESFWKGLEESVKIN
jgi:hypothetical protein